MMLITSKLRKPIISSPFRQLCAGEGFFLLYQRPRFYRLFIWDGKSANVNYEIFPLYFQIFPRIIKLFLMRGFI